jgi:recombination protein RecA
VRSGGVDVMIIDSVAALVPKAELEGEMGDPHMALQARLMVRRLHPNVSAMLLLFQCGCAACSMSPG